MIQSLAIQGFQSHASSLLEFHPGVNVIIGDSDSGKTAILRALTWALTNRPTGDAFRRNGSDKTIVTVTMSDGSISRVRSNKENFYLDGSGEKLTAIGTSVPESVLKLLRMDADLNMQRQLDAPFLLSCSAGDVAQRLNTVVGLDDIDVGLSNVARRVRQNQAIFEQSETRCTELSKQVEVYAYLEAMEREVVSLEDMFSSLVSVESYAEDLTDTLISIDECLQALKKLPDVVRLLGQIAEADGQFQNYNEVYGEAQRLSDLVGSIEETKEELRKIPNTTALLHEVGKIEDVLQQLREDIKQAQLGSELVAECEVLHRDYSILEVVIASQEEQFWKESPTVCPLCGGRKG